eukprot:1160469-Pelagomonas_calceolata.AAC.12
MQGHPGRDLKEDYKGTGTLPATVKEKETHWFRRAVSPPHHKAAKQKVLMGPGGLLEAPGSRA